MRILQNSPTTQACHTGYVEGKNSRVLGVPAVSTRTCPSEIGSWCNLYIEVEVSVYTYVCFMYILLFIYTILNIQILNSNSRCSVLYICAFKHNSTHILVHVHKDDIISSLIVLCYAVTNMESIPFMNTNETWWYYKNQNSSCCLEGDLPTMLSKNLFYFVDTFSVYLYINIWFGQTMGKARYGPCI